MKIVFLLNRYVTLFGQSFLTLEELGLLSHGSRKVLVSIYFVDAYRLAELERGSFVRIFSGSRCSW